MNKIINIDYSKLDLTKTSSTSEKVF